MYIPTEQAPPSQNAQELGGHLARLIQAFQADHPEMSPFEVRQAVRLAQQSVVGPNTKMMIKGVLLGLVAFMGLGVYAFMRFDAAGGQVPWILVTAGILVVTLAAFALVASKQ